MIGKLPKTLDGVEFAQGLVYVNGSWGGSPHIFEFEATARWVGPEPYIGHSWGEKIDKPYSTREAAALAAKDDTLRP